MYLVVQLAIAINIISIIVLLFGLFYNFGQPKIKAVYGYTITGCFIAYMVVLSIVAIYGLITKNNLYGFILLLCVISPFVIGKFVKYETLKKYTVVQIVCFVLSLVTLFLK